MKRVLRRIQAEQKVEREREKARCAAEQARKRVEAEAGKHCRVEGGTTTVSF